MNIMFLLPRYQEESESSTLEKELVFQFSKSNNCSVISLSENKNTYIKKMNDISIFKINVGDYYSKTATKIDKGLTMFKLPFIFKYKIKKEYKNKKIDLIILGTPMMNSPSLMQFLKRYFGCKILLIVWDIFPQNGIDIGVIKNKLLSNIFENKYKNSLKEANYISSMSQGNYNYLSEKFKTETSNKIFILKNWAQIKEKVSINKKEIREKYNFQEKDFICIFGGNMGKPQRLENILLLAKKSENENIKFLFVGKGTENLKLKKIKEEKKLENVIFLDYIPRNDYELLTASCDIGIVSLDERFTVPNFPSKTTDYFKLELPILASLDKCSAQDYGKFLEEEVQGGLYSEAGNTELLYEKLMTLYNNKELREQLGKNGRKYYEDFLGVDKAYETIMNVVNQDIGR